MGLEPTTYGLQSRRSCQLSYAPGGAPPLRGRAAIRAKVSRPSTHEVPPPPHRRRRLDAPAQRDLPDLGWIDGRVRQIEAVQHPFAVPLDQHVVDDDR